MKWTAALAMVMGVGGDLLTDVAFERMRLLTNDFTNIATESPITLEGEEPTMLPNKMYTIDGNVLAKLPVERRPGQFSELLLSDLERLGLMETKFNLELGDTLTYKKKPVLVKSRMLGDRNAILYPINKDRHFPPDVFRDLPKYDIPFGEKTSKLIWRGATTGGKTGRFRFMLMEAYFESHPLIDVGFTKIVQGEINATKWLKPLMTWQEMIRYKYMLSVEGNDVATGLKWQLYSNSVVFMPPPTKETWFLETNLKPYVHYVPIDPDLSNLEAQVDWAEAHPKECAWISANATTYATWIWRTSIVNKDARQRVLKLAFDLPLE
mmetsp:Transcript_2031/g.5175  ORF Transcript_2031/g.5175 Transcript_2031/m.5175 type:complete len:323 (-) Transcript_2031:73-1041(-)